MARKNYKKPQMRMNHQSIGRNSQSAFRVNPQSVDLIQSSKNMKEVQHPPGPMESPVQCFQFQWDTPCGGDFDGYWYINRMTGDTLCWCSNVTYGGGGRTRPKPRRMNYGGSMNEGRNAQLVTPTWIMHNLATSGAWKKGGRTRPKPTRKFAKGGIHRNKEIQNVWDCNESDCPPGQHALATMNKETGQWTCVCAGGRGGPGQPGLLHRRGGVMAGGGSTNQSRKNRCSMWNSKTECHRNNCVWDYNGPSCR